MQGEIEFTTGQIELNMEKTRKKFRFGLKDPRQPSRLHYIKSLLYMRVAILQGVQCRLKCLLGCTY